MEDLARNNRNFLTATVIMLLVTAAVITLGMVLFPLSAYDNPNAGFGLINTPQGNLLVISMFGVIAANVGVFLNRIIHLERERTEILERGSVPRKESTSLPPPPRGSIESGNK